MNTQIEILDKALANLHQKYYDNSWHLFLWGVLTLVACSLHYSLMQMGKFDLIWMPWFAVMLLGSIVEIVMSFKGQAKKQSSSTIEKSIGLIWLLLGISNFFIAFIAPNFELISFSSIVPLIMIQVWIGILFTGLLIKFKPLIILANVWIVSTIIILIKPEANQILLLAASVLIGYLLPGFLLRNECKKLNG